MINSWVVYYVSGTSVHVTSRHLDYAAAQREAVRRGVATMLTHRVGHANRIIDGEKDPDFPGPPISDPQVLAALKTKKRGTNTCTVRAPDFRQKM
jgi:hypothetical protein